jgi:hypothetical protein
VAVMSYESLKAEADWAAGVDWDYVILDEGHVIRSVKSRVAVAAKRLRCGQGGGGAGARSAGQRPRPRVAAARCSRVRRCRGPCAPALGLGCGGVCCRCSLSRQPKQLWLVFFRPSVGPATPPSLARPPRT